MVEKEKLLKPTRCQPPKIIKSPSNLENILAGDDVKLTCVATAYPPPLVLWYRHKTLIIPSETEIDKNGQLCHFQYKEYGNNATLQIHGTRWFDTGEYHCRVINALGEDKFSIEIVVNDQDQYGNTLSKTTTKESPAVFLERLNSSSVAFGDTATFEAVIGGFPEPNVSSKNLFNIFCIKNYFHLGGAIGIALVG